MKQTPGFYCLRFDEIAEAYHIKDLFDEYGNKIDCSIRPDNSDLFNPYRILCLSHSGKEVNYVYCGSDFFGSRLYFIDDVNY